MNIQLKALRAPRTVYPGAIYAVEGAVSSELLAADTLVAGGRLIMPATLNAEDTPPPPRNPRAIVSPEGGWAGTKASTEDAHTPKSIRGRSIFRTARVELTCVDAHAGACRMNLSEQTLTASRELPYM